VTRPGGSVEGITVPPGDPDALRGGARQLHGIHAQLQDTAARLHGLPSLMASWAGPASSSFAQLSGTEAQSVAHQATSVWLAATGIEAVANRLEAAQETAQRAIKRAKRARIEIDRALKEIEQAEQDQQSAKDRMALAAVARAAAEQDMLVAVVDAVAGTGVAAAAAAQADAEYRAAERDLGEAQRREARARSELEAAREEMREARADGRAAAEDAESAGLDMVVELRLLPDSIAALPGAPAEARLGAAAPYTLPPEREVPIAEREPPEDWPWWAKEWFKVGRGTATAIDGTVDLAGKAIDHPERIPGALGDVASSAYHDPLGTGKQLVGYDLLANGQYADWLGQSGFAALTGGAGAMTSRGARLRRLHGPPKLVPLGRLEAPMNAKFAGRRFDFRKDDLGVPAGTAAPKMSPEKRLQLADEFPAGVRFTRAGYPVFTPYAIERVHVDQRGDWSDFDAANRAAGFNETPQGFTWHHVEDGRTMELVPRELHQAVRHTGGGADPIGAQSAGIAPGGVLTPGERLLGGAGAGAGGTAGLAGAQGGGP
jgi:hypothetical protein